MPTPPISDLQTSTPSLPPLTDEALLQILRHLPPYSLLSTLCVSRQFRAATLHILSYHPHLDLSALYLRKRDGAAFRCTPPYPQRVVKAVQSFRGVKSLTIRRWPFHDVMPDIVRNLSAVRFERLQVVDLTDIELRANWLHSLLLNNPSITSLRVGQHHTIYKALTDLFQIYIKKDAQLKPRPLPLQTLIVHGTSCRSHLLLLLSNRVLAERVSISGPVGVYAICIERIAVEARERPPLVHRFSLCTPVLRDVQYCTRGAPDGDLKELNLSQCLLLQRITCSTPTPDGHISLSLRILNLSGCRHLSEISPPAGRRLLFPHLQQLILFGCRSLRETHFSTMFPLEDKCVMPCLERINLDSTKIQRLSLVSYPALREVRCSGCPDLRFVKVADCWAMTLLAIRGSRMPLERVSICVGKGCEILGVRETWKWEKRDSFQSVIYPA